MPDGLRMKAHDIQLFTVSHAPSNRQCELQRGPEGLESRNAPFRCFRFYSSKIVGHDRKFLKGEWTKFDIEARKSRVPFATTDILIPRLQESV